MKSHAGKTMYIYKLCAEDLKGKPIEQAVFEEDTRKARPWYVTEDRKDGKEDRQYAVCPACDNPIQLIGLYKPLPHTPRAYARHTGKRIEGFPQFDPDVFTWCPFIKRRPGGNTATARKLNAVSIKILALVMCQFDRIIHILRQETGLKMSPRFAGHMLDSWLAGEGYLYPGATLQNIPWMVAYRSKALSIFGQTITDNEELKNAILKRLPEAGISNMGKIGKGTGAFYKIHGVFLDHRNTLIDGELTETVQFDVSSGRTPTGKPNVIYNRTITFNPVYFERLIGLPPERAYRDRHLLSVARTTYQNSLPASLLARVQEVIEELGLEGPTY